MDANKKKITCVTKLEDILDSTKYLPNYVNTEAGQLCKSVTDRLGSKIESLHSMSDGTDSLMATAIVIDDKPYGQENAQTIVGRYEVDKSTFENRISQMELNIVERELDELKELINCLDEKLGSLYDSGVKRDDPQFLKYKNIRDEADGRFSRVKSLYYSLPSSRASSGSKLAEAKAIKSRNEDYEIPKHDYLDMVNRNWYSSLSVISGKSPEDLGVSARDRVVFDSALETFKKHFEGKNPTPVEMVIYWDNIKAGTTEDYTFGREEREIVKKVANIISSLDNHLYGFSFDISIWAKSNGVKVDEEAYDEFINSKVFNTPYYYRTALEETKFNK